MKELAALTMMLVLVALAAIGLGTVMAVLGVPWYVTAPFAFVFGLCTFKSLEWLI